MIFHVRRNQTVFVGTMHYGRKGSHARDAIMREFRLCGGLTIERPQVSPSFPAMGESQMLECLGDRRIAAVEQFYSCRRAKMVWPTSPEALTLSISAAIWEEMGFRHSNGVETQLSFAALQREIKLCYLETPTAINDAFRHSWHEQLDWTLESLEQTKDRIGRLHAAWETGNLLGMELAYSEVVEHAPSIAHYLIEARNEQWLQQIVRELNANEPTMIAVGALHFCGESSLVSLLAGRGFDLHRATKGS
jgi:uncharacterized protein YbaP (TraB family)